MKKTILLPVLTLVVALIAMSSAHAAAECNTKGPEGSEESGISYEPVEYLHLIDIESHPDGNDPETGMPRYIFHYSIGGKHDIERPNMVTIWNHEPGYMMLYHKAGRPLGDVEKCTLYEDLPKLSANDFECSNDGYSFSCHFRIEGTVDDIKETSVVVRSNEWWVRLWYSASTSLYNRCTIARDEIDCRPGTQACADRAPSSSANPSDFYNYYGSRNCVDERLDDAGDDIDHSAYASRDYELLLTGALHDGSHIKSYRPGTTEVVSADVAVDYTYVIEGPYDGEENSVFEDRFLIIVKNEIDSDDYDFSGTFGLTSHCSYDDGTVHCAFTHTMLKKSIGRQLVKIYNASTNWLSPAKRLNNCEEDLPKPADDYSAPLANYDIFDGLPNADETIAENVCAMMVQPMRISTINAHTSQNQSPQEPTIVAMEAQDFPTGAGQGSGNGNHYDDSVKVTVDNNVVDVPGGASLPLPISGSTPGGGTNGIEAQLNAAGCSMIPRAVGGMGGIAIFLIMGLLGPVAITRFRRK